MNPMSVGLMMLLAAVLFGWRRWRRTGLSFATAALVWFTFWSFGFTKGFKETEDIIKNFGGDISTASEYCGFGDLVLTSTSTESRNHTLGMLYGQRIIVDEKASGIVFEGKNSIMAVKDICTNTNTESVVVDFVYDVIVKQIPPKIAFNRLWSNIE